MSCFGGKMKEYAGVSLDRFDGENLSSAVYCLSHFHSDHTVGLESLKFLERLQSRQKTFLYCSEITGLLMLADNRYSPLKPFVKTLEVGVPTTIPIPDDSLNKDESVVVTLLQAGHCPGSVMLKDIQSAYVDTTFCFPEAFYIPSRKDCVDSVCSLIDDWLLEDETHYVHIASRCRYGHEHLFAEVAKHTGMKIHVSHHKYSVYSQIPDLELIFTDDPAVTKIHACYKPDCPLDGLPCGYLPEGKLNLIVIRPSTMWFTQKVHIKDIIVQQRQIYRACYSFHSSYQEIRELITYLQPRYVYPNVRPHLDKTMKEVQDRLNQFLEVPLSDHWYESQSLDQPLGILHKRMKPDTSLQAFTASESLVFDSLSPVKKPILSSSSPASSPVKSWHSSPIKNTSLGTPPLVTSGSSDAQSLYQGSCLDDSELDLCCDLEQPLHPSDWTYIESGEEDDDIPAESSEKCKDSAHHSKDENMSDFGFDSLAHNLTKASTILFENEEEKSIAGSECQPEVASEQESGKDQSKDLFEESFKSDGSFIIIEFTEKHAAIGKNIHMDTKLEKNAAQSVINEEERVNQTSPVKKNSVTCVGNSQSSDKTDSTVAPSIFLSSSDLEDAASDTKKLQFQLIELDNISSDGSEVTLPPSPPAMQEDDDVHIVSYRKVVGVVRDAHREPETPLEIQQTVIESLDSDQDQIRCLEKVPLIDLTGD